MAGVGEALPLTDPSPPSNLQPRYNICPTNVDAVIERDSKARDGANAPGSSARFGGTAAQRVAVGNLHARAETVAEKPFFRSAFKHTRCLIPASGYYYGRRSERKNAITISRPPNGQIILSLGFGRNGQIQKQANRKTPAP